MRIKLLFLTALLFFFGIGSFNPTVGNGSPQETTEGLENVNQVNQPRDTQTPDGQGEGVITPDQSGDTEATGEDGGTGNIGQQKEEVANPAREVEETSLYSKLEPQEALEAFIQEGCSASRNVIMQLDNQARGNAISYCDYQENSKRFLKLSPDVLAIAVTILIFIFTELFKSGANRADRKNDLRLKAADIIIKTGTTLDSNNALDAQVKLETLQKLSDQELSDLVTKNLFDIQYQQTYEALQRLAKKDGMTDHQEIDRIVGNYIKNNLIDR
ncbi:MAG: hypothetical protein AAF652_09145 [Cyanobacteria bacterium P01_C01_bin.72]